ncbi:uncharacterized protein BDZ99DRAFT_423858 [Mytilinidion resinicola]|uniref:DNA/RNA-binding domain-containing protein n=1 Tax=Mytilinidion resinicola TaxID=574789 RepID=A0A6A6Y9Q5_9PEZI|nr:uncharacterized protein BDZ99DRAFT_423858 [Mytilinidion resinicola]KAF2805546.1 hypothetical protein BDZ99DRAFT_423858 [Mytilinidion resinicola]
MVETKCIHVDRAQASVAPDSRGDSKLAELANDHWQALIALHRTLLHEHHDFFLASQHPSAFPALRRLASKYSMPARMWKHGIHSFLELLRRRLPESLDYMLAFIYLAYQMMSLLHETVPTFKDTWIECLGDLTRYRMAIKNEDLRDRETWAGVARFWYSKAADKSPYVGRLYHHLAILVRPNALQQLYYYSRSLTCVVPFMSARESILTLLDPILGRSSASYTHSLPIDTSFIRAHGILFGRLSTDAFEESKDAFLDQLDNHIGRVTAKWNEQGVFIAVTNIAGFFDYGSHDSPLRLIYQSYAEKIAHKSQRSSSPLEQHSLSRSPSPSSLGSKQLSSDRTSSQVSKLSHDVAFSSACRLAFSTFALVLRRIGDKNVLTRGPHPQPSESSNTNDGVLLESKQIRHGCFLPEHPHLIEEFKANNVGITLCPISNALLHFCGNIKEHSCPRLLAVEIPSMANRDSYGNGKEDVLTCSKTVAHELSKNCLSLIRKASSLFHCQFSHFVAFSLFVKGVLGRPTGEGRAITSGVASSQPNGRKILIEKLEELLVSSTSLMVPFTIIVVAAVISRILVWYKAQGKLALGVLLAACVFKAVRLAENAGGYILLAVGLTYLFFALGICRLGRGSPFIATTIGILITIVVIQFQPIRDFWTGLTGLDSSFAICVGIPLSFYCCDLVVMHITKAVQSQSHDETHLPSPHAREASIPIPLGPLPSSPNQNRRLRQQRDGDEGGLADDEIDRNLASQIRSWNDSLPNRRTTKGQSS